MKILILNAIKEWILQKYNFDVWKEIAIKSELNVEKFQHAESFYTDERFTRMVGNMAEILRQNRMEMVNEFIQFWMIDFAPKVYQYYLKKFDTAKDVILGILHLNSDLCRLMPNNYLASVDFQEISTSTISVIYPSEKSLVDIIAILRGLNQYFKTKFTINKINPHSIQIIFEK